MNSPQSADVHNKYAWSLIKKRIENENKHKNALVWGTINFGVFSVLAYDVYYTCPFYSWPLYYIEVLLATVFFLCSLYNMAQYLRLNHFTSPIELTAQQFRLFNICKQDPNFKLKYSSTPVVSPDVTPLNLSSNSWLSSSFAVPSPNDSRNPPSPSMIHHFDKSQSIVYDELDPIDNRDSYREYSIESNNRSLTIDYSLGRHASPGADTSLDGGGGMGGLFRSFWASPDAKGYTSVMKSPVYQPSPVSPNKILSDPDSKSRLYLEEEVWKKLKINPYNLTKWTNNLKLWIHRTILSHLVKEIDAVNKTLQSLSMPDIQVGCVGLERLRSLLATGGSTLGTAVPSLSLLVRFLGLTPNQEYVVQRIRELSRNWYLSDYRWNGGGQAWDSHLPSDARLLLHLLVTYLDSLGPALGAGSSSFSSTHFTSGGGPKGGVKVGGVKGSSGGGAYRDGGGAGFGSTFRQSVGGDAASSRGGVGREGGGAYGEVGGACVSIHEASVSPPHYQLHVAPDHVYEIPKGRTNMFETVLAFLHFVRTREHGVLNQLNLGPTGANMLWIVDDAGSTHSSPK